MNKKICFVILALLGAFSVNAQTQKGNQLLGGNIYLSTIKNTNDYFSNPFYSYSASNTSRTNALGIGPTYSYFIANNLDLGATVGYSTVKTTYTFLLGNVNNQPSEIKTNAYSASVFLRKYYLYNNKIGIRTGPFAQYSQAKTREKYDRPVDTNGNYTNKEFSAGLGLDVVFFPTKHLGFATRIGSLSYSHGKRDQYNAQYKDDRFSLDLATSGLTLSAFYAFSK